MNDDKFFIFGSIFFISQKWQTISDKVLLQHTDITTKQWMLIVLLEKVFKGLTPTISEAASAFGTSRQNIKRIANDLEKKNYLLILPDGKDGRIQRLALTGHHKLFFSGKKNEIWQNEYIEKLFKKLDPEEITHLKNYVKKLVSVIKAPEK